MNQGTFAGYLGRDSELRNTPSGQSVCNFSVGVSIGFGDKKKTLWVGCAIWGERAEKLEQYLKKGQAVTVSGDVDLRIWESKGKSGSEITLNCQRVTLMGKGGKSEGREDRESKRSESAPAGKDEFEDSEIPF